MAEHAHTTGAARPLPFEIIDLDNHPDGSLLRMCAALIRLRETLDGACTSLSHPRAKQAAEGVRRLVERAWELREGIAATPARTPEGLLEKARIALWEAGHGDIDTPVGPDAAVAWIVGDHYVIEHRGVAITVHCRNMADGKIGVQCMGREMRAMPISRKKLERKLLGRVYEDPEQVGETFRLLEQIRENLDARWTEPGRQPGWLPEKEARP